MAHELNLTCPPQRRESSMSKRRSGRRKKRRERVRLVRAQRRCGRYELLDRLGVGGMAEVYRARVSGPAGFRRDVVLKRLLPVNEDDPEFVNMFRDEARILGVLNHPNVVQALDFGVDHGAPYLVLEYLDGPSLGRVLRAGRAVAPAIAAHVAREICRALDYMHRAADLDGTPLGLVHRDVTPSNIVVTRAGAVKLLDFGIAKFARALQSTRAGFVKGKSAYLAPEQLQGLAFDGRADVFSLGVVLHELLTGRRLFAGDTDLATMRNVLHLKVPLPSRVRAGISPALDHIVLRALARNPARRYATAADMARDLDEVVLASGLRLDHVAAFVREIEETARPRSLDAPAPAAADLSTERELLLPARRWVSARFSARRAALVTGLTLALGAAGAFRWGMKPHVASARTLGAAVAAAPVH
jgi:serine/threonine-protein kinase